MENRRFFIDKSGILWRIRKAYNCVLVETQIGEPYEGEGEIVYGFAAISASNGWSMAVLGASIVFCGLVVLSLSIAQIHKLLNLWENRGSLLQNGKAKQAGEVIPAVPIYRHPDYCPEDIEEVARIWSPLAEKLDETFVLPALFQLAREYDFPHPHLTITRLREARILIPVGEEGVFMWNQSGVE